MSESEGRAHYMKGSLGTVPVPKVFHFFSNSEKTGVLALTNGKKKVHLHFNKGRLVYATSTYFPDMSIGDYLVQQEVISDAINQQSKNDIKTTKQKQGAWLLERGHVTPHQLYEALNAHVRIKLLSIFPWNEGEYYFRDGEIVDKEFQVLNLKLPALIYEGVRDHFQMAKMPREFKGRKESLLFKRTAPAIQTMDLPMGPTETRLFDKLVNGKLTLRQVVAASKMKPKHAYKVIYALYMLELIGFPENVGKTKPPADGKTPTPKPGTARKAGYDVDISSDIIEQAMASVDRIKKEVTDSVEDELDLELEDDAARLSASVAEPRRAERRRRDEPAEDEIEPPTPVSWEDAAAPTALKDDLPIEEEGDEWPSEEEEPPTEEGPAKGRALPDLSTLSVGELLQLGHDLLLEMDYDRALEVLQRAKDMDANRFEIYPLLGWAMFNVESTQDGLNRAEQTIKNGIKLKPNLWQAYLYLGKIYRTMGEDDFAELHFVKALEYNVDCQEARDEIRRIHSG